MMNDEDTGIAPIFLDLFVNKRARKKSINSKTVLMSSVAFSFPPLIDLAKVSITTKSGLNP